jgi:hypothetical protein
LIEYGDVPNYLTPPPQSLTLLSGETILFVGNYTFPDANQNHISDLWEEQYLGGVSHSNPPSDATDQDGDGASDYAEFQAGTNPTNSASFLKLDTPLPTGGGSAWVCQWQATPGYSYRIMGSADMVRWTPLTEWQREAGGDTARPLVLPPNTPQQFLRLEVRP